MRIKVKDFARSKGVSDSIVYRHIREHREELGDSIVKEAKATWLTDEAQNFLSDLMITHPVVVGDAAQLRELDELREKCDRLRELIDKKDDVICRLMDQVENQQAKLASFESEKKLLESEMNRFELEKIQEITELQHELEIERNRPLTLRERFTGRKQP